MKAPTLKALIADSDHIVAFTGAGISTESGLPDFRGPEGLWTKDPASARIFNIGSFRKDQSVRDKYWASRLGTLGAVVPNDGHKALATLHAAGKLSRVITQNIDGLHQAAGVPDDLVYELHGSMTHVNCLGCGMRISMEVFLSGCEGSGENPSSVKCYRCGNAFKPGVVMFGEELDEGLFDLAYDAMKMADLLLVLGSSLTVYPAALLVGFAQRNGVINVIINREETEYDDEATLVLRGGIGEILSRAV